MHSSSRVKHKGTFLGVREKLPYLKELGINQIQCMPVYEFQEDMGSYRNYWGYGTGYYFAPKAAYAAFDDAQTELKESGKSVPQSRNRSCSGNAVYRKILPQTALECLRFYLLEYHVDGFVVNPLQCAMGQSECGSS